jgi:hypothetical protein
VMQFIMCVVFVLIKTMNWKLGSFDRSSLKREAQKIYRKIRSKAQEGSLDSLYAT